MQPGAGEPGVGMVQRKQQDATKHKKYNINTIHRQPAIINTNL